MALSQGPYYEKPTQNIIRIEHGHHPDMITTTAPSVQMRSLTSDSLPIAQCDHQLNSLLKAATAAGSQDTRYLQNAVQDADELEPVSTSPVMIGRYGNVTSFTGDPLDSQRTIC